MSRSDVKVLYDPKQDRFYLPSAEKKRRRRFARKAVPAFLISGNTNAAQQWEKYVRNG